MDRFWWSEKKPPKHQLMWCFLLNENHVLLLHLGTAIGRGVGWGVERRGGARHCGRKLFLLSTVMKWGFLFVDPEESFKDLAESLGEISCFAVKLANWVQRFSSYKDEYRKLCCLRTHIQASFFVFVWLLFFFSFYTQAWRRLVANFDDTSHITSAADELKSQH